MEKDAAKVGLKVKSVVNPDRHYRIIGVYSSYAKVSPIKSRVCDEYNIEFEYLEPLTKEELQACLSPK